MEIATIGMGDRAGAMDAVIERCKAASAYLKANPKCSVCGKPGAVVAFRREGVWRGLCEWCHSDRAARERSAAKSAAQPARHAASGPSKAAAPAVTMRTLRGLAWRWGTESQPWEHDTSRSASERAERVRYAPGAFARAIARRGIRCRIGHDAAREVGRQSDGTLTLAETDDGLMVMLRVREDSEVVRLAEAGKLRGWSLGSGDAAVRYEPVTRYDGRGGIVHTSLASFSDVALDEVSLVVEPEWPAAPGTTIELV